MKHRLPLTAFAALSLSVLPGCVHITNNNTGATTPVVIHIHYDKPCEINGAAMPTPVTPVSPESKPIKLTVVSADSEETEEEDNKAANAVDGDANTLWHTKWGTEADGAPPCPHEIVFALSRADKIDRFTYLPRQDENDNGTIKEYAVYVSQDGKDFGEPVARGTFENTKDLKVVKFAAVSCRFIKLKALSEVNDGPWSSAAEIGVVREGEEVPEAPKAMMVPESEESGESSEA